MHDNSAMNPGWCRSLSSGLIMVILVFSILGLLLWVTVDYAKATFSGVFIKVSNIVSDAVGYITGIVEFIKSGAPELEEKLKELGDKLAKSLSNIMSNVTSLTLASSFRSKIKNYKEKNLPELIKDNKAISLALSNGREKIADEIEKVLNELDKFLVENIEDITSNDIFIRSQNIISALLINMQT